MTLDELQKDVDVSVTSNGVNVVFDELVERYVPNAVVDYLGKRFYVRGGGC